MKRETGLWERMAIVPHSVWVVLFIVAPLIFVAYYAFTDANGNFSFANITGLTFYGETFLMSVCFSLIELLFSRCTPMRFCLVWDTRTNSIKETKAKDSSILTVAVLIII